MTVFAREHGWVLDSFTNPNDISASSMEIVFKAEDRIDYFPNKDMLYMINLFDSEYRYGMAIRDGKGYDDQIHKSDGYKIAVIPCNPGQTFTIAHGYTKPCEIVVASCSEYKEQIKVDITSVSNTIDMRDTNGNPMAQGKLGAGGSLVYTASSNASCIVIQMPYNKEANFAENTRVMIQIGDVNQDGKIDQSDLDLLNSYVNGELGYEFEGAQLIAANCCIDYDANGSPIINDKDVLYLRQYLDGERPSLGISYYDAVYDENNNELDKLLVVSVDVGPSGKLAYINVPVSEFYKNPWSIHDKFAGYIMRLNITPYSGTDSIAYAQRIMEYVMQYGTKIRNDIIFKTIYPGNDPYSPKVVLVKEPISSDSDVTRDVYYLQDSDGNSYKLDDLPAITYKRVATGYFDTADDYDNYEDRNHMETYASLKDLISAYQRTISAINTGRSDPLTFTLGYLDIEIDAIMQSDLIGMDIDLYDRTREAYKNEY